ncbi:MAG: hypothetical protein QM765_38900 [Myxococcales bacterium]
MQQIDAASANELSAVEESCQAALLRWHNAPQLQDLVALAERLSHASPSDADLFLLAQTLVCREREALALYLLRLTQERGSFEIKSALVLDGYLRSVLSAIARIAPKLEPGAWCGLLQSQPWMHHLDRSSFTSEVLHQATSLLVLAAARSDQSALAIAFSTGTFDAFPKAVLPTLHQVAQLVKEDLTWRVGEPEEIDEPQRAAAKVADALEHPFVDVIRKAHNHRHSIQTDLIPALRKVWSEAQVKARRSPDEALDFIAGLSEQFETRADRCCAQDKNPFFKQEILKEIGDMEALISEYVESIRRFHSVSCWIDASALRRDIDLLRQNAPSSESLSVSWSTC